MKVLDWISIHKSELLACFIVLLVGFAIMMITMQPDQFTEDYKSSAVIVCDEAFGDANLRLQELPDPVFLRLGGTGTRVYSTKTSVLWTSKKFGKVTGSLNCIVSEKSNGDVFVVEIKTTNIN